MDWTIVTTTTTTTTTTTMGGWLLALLQGLGFWRSTLLVLVIGFVLFVGILVCLPFCLATVALLYHSSHWKRRKAVPRSALYTGRVWHTRFQPVRHAFTYPLFMFGLDLDDMECDVDSPNNSNTVPPIWQNLWPLTLIVSFQTCHHLKNGEGLPPEITTSSATTTTRTVSDNNKDTATRPMSISSLQDRIFRLVRDRTRGSFCPHADTHRVFLLTQLTYCGYCFNPVSFYFVQDRTPKTDTNPNDGNDDESAIRAVVGEVSNTPWNEMHCYVLHPDSIDITKVILSPNALTPPSRTPTPCSNGVDRKITTPIASTQDSDAATGNAPHTPQQRPVQKVRYIFPKTFHVSPFMEMHFDYDWTFTSFSTTPASSGYSARKNNGTAADTKLPSPSSTDLVITNSLRQRHPPQQQLQKPKQKQKQKQHEFFLPQDSSPLQFHAHLHLTRTSLHPYRLAWHFTVWPMQCALIQVWIHFEAARLFVKGVAYQPHPNNSETTASRLIGTLMIPFFALQEWYESTTTAAAVAAVPSTTTAAATDCANNTQIPTSRGGIGGPAKKAKSV